MGRKNVCGFCNRTSGEVETLLEHGNVSICNRCVGGFARKIGLLPPDAPVPRAANEDTSIAISDRLPVTFVHSFEILGHLDQAYDHLVRTSLLDQLRARHWDVSFELLSVRRTDGADRAAVAEGLARYAVEILVRGCEPGRELALRVSLEEEWADLVASSFSLLHDKGTRDLVEPRLRSLGAYLATRAGMLRQSKGSSDQNRP